MPLDVLDNVGKWCEAEILSIDSTTSTLRTSTYWSEKYDEGIPLSSPRLAPFATYTYQGGSRDAESGLACGVGISPEGKGVARQDVRGSRDYVVS